MMTDPYLNRMLADLELAEYTLRADISNRHNEFRTDGESRLKDSQANVDRLHELIRSYKSSTEERVEGVALGNQIIMPESAKPAPDSRLMPDPGSRGNK
jgi:hypothetical protein